MQNSTNNEITYSCQFILTFSVACVFSKVVYKHTYFNIVARLKYNVEKHFVRANKLFANNIAHRYSVQ